MRYLDYKALQAMGFSCEQRTIELSAFESDMLATKFWAEGIRPPIDCFRHAISWDCTRHTFHLTDAGANGMKQWSAYEAATRG